MVLSAPVVVCKVFHVFCVETAISNYLFLQIMNAGNFGLTMTVKLVVYFTVLVMYFLTLKTGEYQSIFLSCLKYRSLC